jgi:alanine dehydrogenase
VKIGVPREIKVQEYRVGLTPSSVREVVAHGHAVLVQTQAGAGIGATDADYERAGATIVGAAADVFAGAEMIVKVKEPQAVERRMLREAQVLFTYLHLAPDPDQARGLIDSGAVCIAYETVETDDRKLPLLAPMSEVAGRLAPQMGAHSLEKPKGGRGILLPGLPGVAPAKVVVLGGGIVGYNAALIAVGMQADVWVLERSVDRMRELETMMDGRITLEISNQQTIDEVCSTADLVIGAVLVTGARAPKLVTREMLQHMKPGAVLVDVAIDQGGCFETSKPTTHSDPTYVVDGIVHYCVANMPGAVPITSTRGLTNVTLPYAELLADKGLEGALRASKPLARGVNVMAGTVTNQPVAESHGLTYTPLSELVDGVST